MADARSAHDRMTEAPIAQPTIEIRAVEPADAPEWAAMRTALWPDDEDAHVAEIAEFFATRGGDRGALPEAVLVAVAATETDRRLVGFAELTRRAYAEDCMTSPVGFLEGWYVVPAYRRCGVGGALVAAAEAWARSRGCRELASDAEADNETSAAAHRALGFEEVGLIRCFRKEL